MKIPDITRDPPRDPELADLLRQADGARAPDRPDWQGLRASILSGAALPLGRLRRRPKWWEYAGGWARPAIPMAAAAGLALAFVVGTLPAPTTAGDAGFPLLEDALAGAMPTAEYQLLAGGAEAEALLRLAVQEP